MKTDIKGKFEELLEYVKKPGMGEAQIRSMESMFFSGFLSCYESMVNVSNTLSDEAAEAAMMDFHTELKAYFAALGREDNHGGRN